MTVSALDQKTVQLMADQMIMKSKTTLTQYEMTKWSLEKTEKGISMIIVFKRMVTSELLTTYMPSLLLIFTTYATTFFKPFFFEAALSVNLTTMLVMTTIFISKMESLPPHLDPGCAIFVRDFFRCPVFGIMTKLMGSPKTHGVIGHVGIREF